ncbi:MAG: UxaA family hydrolase [Firmicutes bacterium]|jgi:altronate dehydratase large subunit|nr:UxaA family hydrolase [Bacillota bacterium]
MNTFLGYPRPDGRVGVRNHVAIITCSMYANRVAEAVGHLVPQAIPIMHHLGIGQHGLDLAQTTRTLIGMGINPNVGACLVISMGNESIDAETLAHNISKTGKPVETVKIMARGGTSAATRQGCLITKELVQKLSTCNREPCLMADLVIGLECGGSDFTSGLASNPTLGEVTDRVVHAGGTAILSETTELIGAEHILARRSVSPVVAEHLTQIVQRYEARVQATGFDMRDGNPSPGNIAGGLTTIEEKSLGCVVKGGTTSVMKVMEYAELVSQKGLVVMDTPGNDVESVTGMVAGGAQIVLFTTGRGTPTGNPVAPVIKITGNNHTAKNMATNIDVDVSGILTGDMTTTEAGEKLYRFLQEVASGTLVKAEEHGNREFAIHRIGMTL